MNVKTNLMELSSKTYVCCYIYMQSVPPDAHQFIFPQGIVHSQSDVLLLFSPSHERIATARSSGANLATLWLNLATFQTPLATLMSSRGCHEPAPVSEQSVAAWPSTSLGRNALWNETRAVKWNANAQGYTTEITLWFKFDILPYISLKKVGLQKELKSWGCFEKEESNGTSQSQWL